VRRCRARRRRALVLLWGRKLDRHVVYLPVNDAVLEAYRHRLSSVVVTTG
jgi:hypothetical protein